MRLTTNEARVLACAELTADSTLAAIAQKCKLKPHIVGYCLRNLEQRGCIRRTPIVNLHCDGFNYLGLYFSLASQHKRQPKLLMEYLIRQPMVTWLTELGGDFQYGLALCVQDPHDAHLFLEQLAAKFPGLLFEKSLVLQFKRLACGRGYLAGQQYRGSPIVVERSAGPRPLDNIDRQILGAMTRSAYQSRRHIASELGLPVATVDLRVRNLEKHKVICGYVYQSDCTLFGMQPCKLIISCKGFERSFGADLFKYACQHPSITGCYETLGGWDYELNVEVLEVKELSGITQELYERFGQHINSIKLLLRYRQHKATQVPF